MAIRADSYGTVAEVLAYTQHLLESEADFGPSTVPTKAQIEKFIDRTSGILNTVIAGEGFTPSAVTANSTAKLALDDYVTTKAARMVELTQPGTGYSAEEGSRLAGFDSMLEDAQEYIKMLVKGWKELGISVTQASSTGLFYTAYDKHSERADPTDTGMEQPKIRRGQFDINSDSTA
jgi:hypothetical protein